MRQDMRGAVRAGKACMARDQEMQPCSVIARHVGEHFDAAVGREVGGVVIFARVHFFFFRDRFEFDHRHIAEGREGAVLIEHIGDAAGHAGRKITAGAAEHDHEPAGHIFAAVVAGALDDGGGA